ncbi:MAG: hypothetical protein M3119_01210 [Verrucomicrobiota bacterium]|nr:hypothetical protein [Verrucomicrobiota bacterium]
MEKRRGQPRPHWMNDKQPDGWNGGLQLGLTSVNARRHRMTVIGPDGSRAATECRQK